MNVTPNTSSIKLVEVAQANYHYCHVRTMLARLPHVILGFMSQLFN
jgi:hypothetical protein